VDKYSNKIRISLPFLIFFAILIGIVPVIIGEVFRLDPELLKKAEQKYGPSARSLLVSWENLIISDTSNS
jgi:hypothetical protein